MLAIGGWGGSKYFSPAVATDANRTVFAKAVMGVVSQYGLDGIEFKYALLALSFHVFIYSWIHSWEYPAKQGIGCNVISTNDSTNFLLFLQTLRAQDCAQGLTISAAVSVHCQHASVFALNKLLHKLKSFSKSIFNSSA